MAIGDMLRASGGFRRNQWTGRNPNSSPLFNQFSSQQQERPPGTMARKAMGLGWQGYNEQGDHSENSRAAIAWLKQNHPTGLQRGMQALGRGFTGAVEGYKGSINPEGLTIGQRRAAVTSPQLPTNVQSPTAPIDRQPYPYRNSLFDETPIELQGIPSQAPPIEQPETQQTVTGTSPNMGMEQFRGRMGAAGFDLNAPTPPQTMIGGSGVPTDVRRKIFRDEMDQRIRGKDLWTGMGIGESAGGQGPPSVERLTQEAEAPLSFWQKAGGFFKKPEVSSAMIATGGKMMEAAGQPGATVLGSLGTGLQAGQEAAAGIREEDRLGRQEGRLDTQLGQQTELYERQLTAEDLSIKREEEKREAYENIFGGGEFDQAAFADAIKLATKHGDVTFAGQLINMYPKDLPMQYEIRSLYNGEKGVNEDYLLKIDPDQGIIDRDYIGISEFDTGGGTTAAMTEMNRGLGEIAANALEGMLEGDIDYYMAGARPDGQGGWTEGSLKNLAGWEAIFADYISAGGGEVEGLARKVFGAGWREVIDERAQRGFTEAYNFINPVVRYLSGAQMTNQEAMRYYTALMPKPNDRMSVLRLKRRKRELLAAAMKGDMASIDRLGVDMSHHSNLMGGEWAAIDRNGTQRMDLILGALDNAVGQTDYYDWSTDPGGAMGTDLVIN